MDDLDERGTTPEGNAVRSVDRAASLLLALGEVPAEAGVTELARRLGLHKSTVSRLLATLERRGLVEQDADSGKYRLGLVMIRLGDQAERTLDLAALALPELQRLARVTREAATLVGLGDDTVVTIARAEAGGHLGPTVAPGGRTGRTGSLHATATGRILLAALPERDLLGLARGGFRRHTARTIVDLEPLLEELSRIRRRGVATAVGELEEGLTEIAAPVIDRRGTVIAAVGLAGPAARLPAARIPELAAQVRSAAAAISLHLGAPEGRVEVGTAGAEGNGNGSGDPGGPGAGAPGSDPAGEDGDLEAEDPAASRSRRST